MQKLSVSFYFIATAIISTTSVANTISTPGKAVIVGNANGSVAKRVCYYQDRAYSVGAILQIGEHYIVCAAENSHETNGNLGWHNLGEEPKKTNQTPSFKVK